MDQMTQKTVTLHIIDAGPFAKEICLEKTQSTTLPVLILILTVSLVRIDTYKTRSIQNCPKTSRYLIITSPNSTVNHPPRHCNSCTGLLDTTPSPLAPLYLHYNCIIISTHISNIHKVRELYNDDKTRS